MFKTLFTLIVCLLCLNHTLFAQATVEDVNLVIPPDAVMNGDYKNAGIINLTMPPYNMPTNGSVDVTEILQRAITEHIGEPYKRKTFYFPNGTYIISDTLQWKKPDGKIYARIRFFGQSREKTIIRLADNAPGYGDPKKPRPMFQTGSINSSGYDFYNNSFWNMTLDVGTGNPGAVALDYNANNEGSLRNLLITSSDPKKAGYCGILMIRAYPGPCFLKDITVDGFQIGMRVRHTEYSVTMENITLKNQSVLGMENMGNVVSIRNLQSINNVPAIKVSSSHAMTTILGGTLTRLDGKSTTINAITNKGVLLLRDITCSDYRLTVHDNTGQDKHLDTGSAISYLSHDAMSLFDDPAKASWPILKDTPRLPALEISGAVSVLKHGAKPNDESDDVQAIQAAIDEVAASSDHDTLYFSPGTYVISKPLVLHGSIRYIEGLGVTIRPNKGDYETPQVTIPILQIKDMTVPQLFINDMSLVKHWQKCHTGFGIQHDSSVELVLTNLDLGSVVDGAYRSSETSGNVYLENCVGSDWRVTGKNQQFFARQWNLEGGMKVDYKFTLSNGASITALGIKTERAVGIGDCVGGSLAIYGGLIYPVKIIPEENGPVIFKLNHTAATINYAEVAYKEDRNYESHIVETRDTTTRILTKDKLLPRNGVGHMMPLYVSLPSRP